MMLVSVIYEDVAVRPVFREGNMIEDVTATGTGGREEKPIHEEALAVLVRVVGKQAMPLVALLAAAALSSAATRFGRSAQKMKKSYSQVVTRFHSFFRCKRKLLT